MSSIQLRGWQRRAFALYQELIKSGARSALWEATPGAGKTTAALEVVKHQLSSKRAAHALIVVPTSHLRVQWARAALRSGLHLDSALETNTRGISREFQGGIVTYQQFGRSTKAFRQLAQNAIVILDEVHHAGEGNSWGDAIVASLERASFVLCLSGTAFRSDNCPIPYVRYSKDGESEPDFSYSYADAVSDRVCRPTAVVTYGGEVQWVERTKTLAASFADPLDHATSARRLRAALDPVAGWIQPLVADAHRMLQEIRREHSNAGALMVCGDQGHARKMAGVIAEISGERPTIVLSDDARSSKRIKDFVSGSESWIVACNMVSEGVDIPRLRVGVYATTIRTKMYFRQFLGRIVRRQSTVTGLQVSYLYLPADPLLRQFAEEIEDECRHVLGRGVDRREDLRDAPRIDRDDAQRWAVLQARNSGVESVIVHGNQLSLFGGPVTPVESSDAISTEVAKHVEERLSRSEEKEMLAGELRRVVAEIHRRTGKSHSEIHMILNRTQNVRSQTQCTEMQLRDRLRIASTMLEGASRSSVRSGQSGRFPY